MLGHGPDRHLDSDRVVVELTDKPKIFSTTSVSFYLEARVAYDSRETRWAPGCFPAPTVFLLITEKGVSDVPRTGRKPVH
jgi:hypothetical protein